MNTNTKENVPSNNPAPNTNPAKQSKTTKIIIVLAVLFALWIPGLIIWQLIIAFLHPDGNQSGNSNIISGESEIKVAFPVGNKDLTVRKKISAKDGGQVSVNLPNGMTGTVIIPPGSLNEDTEIEVTPFPGNGGNNPDDGGNDSPSDRDDTPEPPSPPFPPSSTPPVPPTSPEPPTPPATPDSGSDPGTEPEADCQNPPCIGGTYDPPVIPRIPSGVIVGPFEFKLAIPAAMVFTFPDGTTSLDPNNTMIFVDPSASNMRVIPTMTNIGYGSDGRQFIGGGIIGSISGGGAFAPDKPSGAEAQALANSEGSRSNGKCTPEFQEAAKNIKNLVLTGRYSGFDRALEDCTDTDSLEQRCKDNPISLKLKEFEFKARAAESLHLKENKVKISQLKLNCAREYEISASGNGETGEGVIPSSGLSAKVCGYIDETWNGNYYYKLTVSGIEANSFKGKASFKIGDKGFFAAGAQGEFYIAGAGALGLKTSPIKALPFWGNYDGVSKVDLDLYAGVHLKNIPIGVKDNKCKEKAENIPLVPLPQAPAAKQIPLVPLPGISSSDPDSENPIPLKGLVQ